MIVQYAAAGLAVGLATLVTAVLHRSMGTSVSILFFPAIIATAVFVGLHGPVVNGEVDRDEVSADGTRRHRPGRARTRDLLGRSATRREHGRDHSRSRHHDRMARAADAPHCGRAARRWWCRTGVRVV